MIHNPVLPGFHPDPSIIRVGDDYYLANSTFEWWPGVALFHSRDLAHWRPVGHALTRPSQMNLLGVPDSSGLWAPSLSYSGGKFWLTVCLIRTRVGNFKDMQVLILTADAIEGPWSDPIVVDSWGFDPSLFHDDDGKTYLANIQWDYRKGKPRYGGVYLQEFDPHSAKMMGEKTLLIQKPVLIEGPNLYKRDGWYYLMCAEGGTGWNHGISMARSRNLRGPYEIDPAEAILTSRRNAALTLQKAGHGELVQTQSGEWYLAHLASRPVYPERRCMLGRETCIQKVEWSDDGWLRLLGGGTDAKIEVDSPRGVVEQTWERETRNDFDRAKTGELGPEWCSLRGLVSESWCSLRARPGYLRLTGGESQHSLFEQSLVARRLESFNATATTSLEFSPTHFTQSAGLICYYDTRTHFYLRVTHHEEKGKVLGVVLTDDGVYDEVGATLDVNTWKQIHLRAEIDHEGLQFSASADGKRWDNVGPLLDASKLSDDYGTGLHFTGPMIGLCAQDLNRTGATADFDHFELLNR